MSLFGSFFGKKTEKKIAITTPLDAVTYAAGLVSNQADINTMLDTVRDITARLGPSGTVSPQDNMQLISVYLKLEHYLITQEAIRTFTKEDLRKRIAEPLRGELARQETAASSTNKII